MASITTAMPMNLTRRVLGVAAASIVLAAATPAVPRADEGMWTFDHFPSKAVAQKYGFAPTQAWLDHVRSASLRIAGGCSAEQLARVQAFFAAPGHSVSGTERQLANVADQVHDCLRLREREGAAVAAFLKEGGATAR